MKFLISTIFFFIFITTPFNSVNGKQLNQNSFSSSSFLSLLSPPPQFVSSSLSLPSSSSFCPPNFPNFLSFFEESLKMNSNLMNLSHSLQFSFLKQDCPFFAPLFFPPFFSSSPPSSSFSSTSCSSNPFLSQDHFRNSIEQTCQMSDNEIKDTKKRREGRPMGFFKNFPFQIPEDYKMQDMFLNNQIKSPYIFDYVVNGNKQTSLSTKASTYVTILIVVFLLLLLLSFIVAILAYFRYKQNQLNVEPTPPREELQKHGSLHWYSHSNTNTFNNTNKNMENNNKNKNNKVKNKLNLVTMETPISPNQTHTSLSYNYKFKS